MNIEKLLCAAVAASLTLGSFAAPALALAQESGAQSTETTTRSLTYMAGELEPTFAETITVAGETWALEAVSAPQVDPSFVPESRIISHEEQGTFASKQEAEAAFPTTRASDDADFPGDLVLTGITYEARGESSTQVVDETRVYGPYPTNEVQNTPTSITVTRQGQGGTYEMELQRAFAQWEVAEVNAAGMPVGYNLTVTYRGAVTTEYVSGYVATAHYEAELPRAQQQMLVTATYRAPIAEVVAPEPEIGDEVESSMVLPVALAGGATAVVAAGLLFFVRGRNVSVCSKEDEKVLAKVRATRRGTKLYVSIPTWISKAQEVALVLRPELCDGGALVVRQAGKTIFEGFAQKRVDVVITRGK